VTIAGGIFLIAVGAILRYATNINVQGVSLDTVGLILMIAGAAGLVLSFFQEVVWSRRRDRREIEERELAAREQAAREQPRDPGAPPPPRY